MDVVAITETWLHQRIMHTEILDSSYVIFRRDRQQGQRGGGVWLCLKSDFVSRFAAVILKWMELRLCCVKYMTLLYTTQVNSAFRAL